MLISIRRSGGLGNDEIEALLSLEQHDTLLVFSAGKPADDNALTDYTLLSKTDRYAAGDAGR